MALCLPACLSTNDMLTPLLVRRTAVTSLPRRTMEPSFLANASAMRHAPDWLRHGGLMREILLGRDPLPPHLMRVRSPSLAARLA
jgi:hypothetical protein